MGMVKPIQSEERSSILPSKLIRRYASFSYFVLAYAISWLGAFLVASPYWVRGEIVPKMAGLMMFPAMLLGPSIAGTALIAATEGEAGLRRLVLRIYRIGSYRWLATLLIPPGPVIAV